MRGIWEASGRHLGDIWEASGRHLAASGGTGGPEAALEEICAKTVMFFYKSSRTLDPFA